MKKYIFLALVLFGVSSISAENYFYKTGPFEKVSVRGNINVVYTANPDSTGIASYDSARDYSDAFEFSINKGKLTIKENREHEHPEGLPTIRIHSDYLSLIEYEGDCSFTAELKAHPAHFEAKLIGNGRVAISGINTPELKAAVNSGNGTIALSGSCEEAKFSVLGAGVIQADNLQANVVKCSCLGTGTIGCTPIDNLDVRGIGTTKIYYRGNPTIKKMGGARLFPLAEETSEEAEIPDAE